MPTYTQEKRRLAIATPLGSDVLLLAGFTGNEEVSRLFSFQLDLASEKSDIAAKDIIGKQVTIKLLQLDGSFRHFNGYIRQFSYLGTDDRLSRYSAEMVPWLWFLTRTTDCRIFQNKTVPQIIEQVLNECDLKDFEIAEIKEKHPEREYCVQYRESDFNFISRLMEEEGIFYYFKHKDGKHTLVLADQKGAFTDCQEKEVEYATSESAPDLPDLVTRWEHRYEFRSGKFTQTDYNFTTPSAAMLADSPTIVKYDSNTKYELFDYPGEYAKKDDGRVLASIRMAEEEVPHDQVQGAGKCRTFFAGGRFSIKKHFAETEAKKKYVITAVQHSAVDMSNYSTGETMPLEYLNSFTCIPETTVFRPSRSTPKPLVYGSQTAVVVGPSGEEIHTDKYGRVKVQFFWDRLGKKNENSSCWVRVSQIWAGNQWGTMFIPRMGHEVIVDFLEGDPDRPIITGRVYHAENMPPYALPDNKTQSGIKTRSSKDGTPDNFNEIRFEDKKGSEQLFIHAEKNQDIEVENDETHWVGHDRTKTIDNDETTHVKHDRTETVDNNETITIHANRTETVDKDEKITIHGNRTEVVDKDETITIHANRTETVDSNESITIQKDQSIAINGNRSEQVAKNETVTVSQNRSHTVSKNDTLTVSKVLSISAGDEITIKTGSASINMKKNGDITISGKNINIKGSGDVVIKGKKILEN